ncbi:MAG: hypothetical protein O7G87_08945 [bacterium]|nr:hypothetical protein [bacterium]
MNRPDTLLTNRYVLAYGAALLLHLLLFLFQKPLSDLLLKPKVFPVTEITEKPLAFEFVDVPEQNPVEIAPETPLVSDQNARARDENMEDLPEGYLAYSEGMVRAREDFQLREKQEESQGQHSGETVSNRLLEAIQQAMGAIDFSSTLQEQQNATEQEREEAVYGKPAIPKTALPMDHRSSSALDRGGLQLSTYAWNFAPYLAYLKRHIENHIFPPAAFSPLGIIDGETVVRFKIYRDGTLKDLEMLGFEGSPRLRDTSVRAIELSADFKALPRDFPEPFLEVTGTFEYLIFRRSQ